MPGQIVPQRQRRAARGARAQGRCGRLEEGQADKEDEQDDRRQSHGAGNGQPEKENDDRIGQ